MNMTSAVAAALFSDLALAFVNGVRPVREEVRALTAHVEELKWAVGTVATTLNTHGETSERLTASETQLQNMLQREQASATAQ